MEERESELEARLSSLTVQLLSEQRSNNILRSEVDLLHAREKANLEMLRELKEQLGNALVERDNLRDENNWLRFKLSDNRNIVEEEHTVTDEVTEPRQLRSECSQAINSPRSGDHTSLSPRSQSGFQLNSPPGSWSGSSQLVAMGNPQDDLEKTQYLEQQVISLTRDKKQLLTHLHWLSRQLATHSRHENMPCRLESETESMSLEEGNGAKSESYVATRSASGAFFDQGKRVECFDTPQHVQKTHVIGRSQNISKSENNDRPMDVVEDSKTEQQISQHMHRLRTAILTLKERVTKNYETCDSIFQLSFQNIRHPKEPRSYSLWENNEQDYKFSPMKPNESLNSPRSSGLHSLEDDYKLQGNAPSEHSSTLYKNDSTVSLTELAYRRTPKSLVNSSLIETSSRDKRTLSRSLSDQQNTCASLPAKHCEHLSFRRENRRQIYSRPTAKDELDNVKCRAVIADNQENHFSSLENPAKQRETSCNTDISQLVLHDTAFPGRHVVDKSLVS